MTQGAVLLGHCMDVASLKLHLHPLLTVVVSCTVSLCRKLPAQLA